MNNNKQQHEQEEEEEQQEQQRQQQQLCLNETHLGLSVNNAARCSRVSIS